MILLPAIDLKDGRVVRLLKGDFATVHQVADDPVTVARAFADAGAAWVHMVDLDGAKDGVRRNADAVRAVCDTGLRVELGGGIRRLADIEAVFALGVERAVIGSAAVTDPDLVRRAVEAFGPGRIAVGVDARNGRVCTAGWVEDSGIEYREFARRMKALGARHFIFTDIDTDGTLAGPAYEKLAALAEAVGPDCRITASGGVGSNEDLRRLRETGVYGAIVGKAYYTGAVDLALAVREGGPQT